jgi:hypothetical protein
LAAVAIAVEVSVADAERLAAALIALADALKEVAEYGRSGVLNVALIASKEESASADAVA